MRIKLYTNLARLCVIIAMAAIVNGCESDPPSGDLDLVQSSAILVAPACVETVAAGVLKQAVVLPECLQWTYADSRLWLTHTNAIYNCCLDSIKIDMLVGERTITVVEREHLAAGEGCDCICPYILDYHVPNVNPGQYTLILLSDNSYGGGLELLFEIPLDLAATPNGTFCLED